MNVQSKRRAIIDKMLAAQPVSNPISDNSKVAIPEPIAIIGLSGYFPQCMQVQEFWDALNTGRSLIEEIPADRGIDKRYAKWAGLIPDIRGFDPHFFGVMPGEAHLLDPRKRLLLMSVYHAMEDAGYAPASFKHSATGVFVAIEEDEYEPCMRQAAIENGPGTNYSASLLANELSYFFDLRGPSEVINTMCSGAAVAIHRAVRALRSGEIDTAVVGAANLLISSDPFEFLSQTGQLSNTDTVHSFGKDAAGFIRADGVGCILLKPLSQAIKDKDAIYAVIKNTAVNFNGKGGLSMATPNIDAHASVIKQCYKEVDADPAAIGYIEAQGMGNPVADIAEWEACNQALLDLALEKNIRLLDGSCRVSTLKPVTGHMHAASALGALLKIIGSLQANRIYGIPNLKEINPALQLDDQPCRLMTTTADWQSGHQPRMAGLHSYGSGGNNAHLLIEEYRPPESEPTSKPAGRVMIPCSAKTKEQCRTIVENLVQAVKQNPHYSIASVAYTMQAGRDAMPYQVQFVADTREAFIEQASAWLEGRQYSNTELPVDYADGHRLHLPVYPFHCDEYWFDKKERSKAAATPADQASLVKASDIVLSVLSDYLQKDTADIDIEKQFSELGFDSMLVTKIAHSLRRQHELPIEPAVFFEHTTPARLINFVAEELAGNVQSRSQTPAAGAALQHDEPIAIIGMSGSFPQSPTIDALWQNMVNGKHCIEEVPASRWLINEHFEPDKSRAGVLGKSYGKWGGFLENLYYFDPLFFNISPAEVEIMSPKERIFLQCAWHVLEDAGYTPQALTKEQVGVFAGVTRSGNDPYKISPFTISNRVSYVLNFRGPSMTIDTACSSSLVAIHEACQHLRTGECTVALAGGVHAFLDPSHFAVLSGMHMLSPDGVCRSFGDDANGMVPGEGSGLLMLKPLKRAVADGDHIYGVIRGSAINHGGKTNGFTVPNPQAHQQLIKEAFTRSGITAREISYVEAHGTGTSLGDPVEIRGLTEAFKSDTHDTGYCHLGSLKTNIGHLEAAAGVAGLIKILLQMKYRKLVPSLHAATTNPQIDFSKTPFVVQQHLQDWYPAGTDGQPITRIACVSSFGAGGANAHVVVEEHVEQEIQTQHIGEHPFVIRLSAKSNEQLKEQATQLLNFVNTASDLNLHNLAYTLQTGRVAWEKRMAVEIRSKEELVEKLNEFIKIGGAADHGQMQNDVTRQPPRRMSLPGYPFLKEFFGLPQPSIKTQKSLHPLVHENCSTFFEQQYKSAFKGEEFFLRDHIVHAQHILPGVAYLEMVRAAMVLSSNESEVAQELAVQLKNIAWIQPAPVKDNELEVQVMLEAEDNGAARFEIRRMHDSGVIHSSGLVRLIEKPESRQVDLDGLRSNTGYTRFTQQACYEVFKELGLSYGPSHQSIEQLFVYPHQVIARLQLPSVIAHTLPDFVLHPSLLDGAFQSIMGFLMRDAGNYSNGLPIAIPFALEECTVLEACSQNMWAVITIQDGALTGHEADFDNLSFNIDLLDEDGRLCVQMKRYTARIWKQTPIHASTTVLMHPEWQDEGEPSVTPHPSYAQRIVLLCSEAGLPESAFTLRNDLRIITLESPASQTHNRLQNYTLQLFDIVQQLLRQKPLDKILVQLIVPAGGEENQLAALYALLKTAHLENPNCCSQVIGFDGSLSVQEMITAIDRASGLPNGLDIRYVNSRRERKVLTAYHPQNTPPSIPWKNNGVYLITGGTGGLGFLFAKEILQKAPNATLILTGRTALSPSKQQRINDLQETARRIEYKQVNSADPSAVQELINDIISRFGHLSGIIHGAGVLNDGFIVTKEKTTLVQVLEPKVPALVILDEATKHLDLDLFLLCSSTTAVIGNAGQCDYAVANAFMDEFAAYRHKQVLTNERKGHTISVNWPLWKEGGMMVHETVIEEMNRQMGLEPLPAAAAMEALYQAIESGKHQMIVLHGHAKRLLAALQNDHTPASAKEPSVPQPAQLFDERMQDAAVAYFKKLLATAIKLPAARIDAGMAMDAYGIDSIMVMQLTAELEKAFGPQPKTLFFEYRNINELTQYFINTQPAMLLGVLGEVVKAQPTLPTPAVPNKKSRFTAHGKQRTDNNNSLDMAIIGVAGRYPQADNLDQFWENLRAGKNCITEIPPGRWDHGLYFDERKDVPGKTYTKWGGFMNGVDEFDPLFFNMSPKEATLIDPQERLFLQCAYEAVEDAGYTRDTLTSQKELGGNVGVYVGVMWEEYHLHAAQQTAQGNPMVLSSSPSSIANRVSYYFNFHGPCMAVDTMCSSSLTAIHLACNALQRGECEVALAGGVNVSIHPNKYLVLAHGRYASSKGLCESFGQGGDGYVAGEGVGVVVLKPLARAIADKDNIYGVIKGTAINHGGKTNGFSVPDPKAQANVIEHAIGMAGFEAGTISYLEAHGTGTALGDPIEIAGLNKAFQTKERQFCAIGSVKSNIGHCESAAGVAGLTKVLLQMKHGYLVPSLHSGVKNPNIDFEQSPFTVQQELEVWRRPVQPSKNGVVELPRRAGVSSFGAGGSNAHIVIEEYVAKQPVTQPQPYSTVILLSAKTDDQLKTRAQQLLTIIQNDHYGNDALPHLAFTCQVGREHMEARMAVEAAGIEELTEKLTGFLNGDPYIDGLYQGKTKMQKDILALFAGDDDMQTAITNWLQKKKYARLCSLWVNGVEIDWYQLYKDLGDEEHPRRISLPTYPFLRNRYWPDLKSFDTMATPAPAAGNALHALVHRNTSTFSEQRFTSLFTGQEFFLKDHLVNGDKLLPAAAYLEMVHAAMQEAGETQSGGIRIENIVLAQPFSVNGHAQQVHISLIPGNEDAVRFVIYSGIAAGEDRIVHSEGIARYYETTSHPRVDIDALQATSPRFEGTACYALFAEKGIAYGPAQQAVQHLFVSDDTVLARLRLPAAVNNTLHQYWLHPSMIDAALQAAMGFALKRNDTTPLAIPFAIRTVTAYSACTTDMWAVVRNNGRLTFDIDICDETGTVCIRIEGVSSRIANPSSAKPDAIDTLLLTPYWRPEQILRTHDDAAYAPHIVIVDNETIGNQLAALSPGIHIKPVSDAAFEDYALFVFEEIKQWLGTKPVKKMLMQVLIIEPRLRQTGIALAGLLKTTQLENPFFNGQVIIADPNDTPVRLLEKLQQNSQASKDTIIQYEGQKRTVLSLLEITSPNDAPRPFWKDRGIYLITGGAGGLGLIMAKEITQEAAKPTLILTGRSVINEHMEKQLEALRSAGATVQYKQTDITSETATTSLVQKIVREFGRIDGIIHSAGLVRDNFLLRKTNIEVLEVLAPKVKGLQNLDEATKDLPLDVFILFSSTAAITGNVGQADYAMANAYMDRYAAHRNALVTVKQRSGKTLSVNWPLWKDGGIQVTPEKESFLLESVGMMPLETQPAIQALYRAMQQPVDQVMIIHGAVQKLRASFLNTAVVVKHASEQKTAVQAAPHAKQAAITLLKDILSNAIQLPSKQINAEKPMEEYGIDSVMVMQMTSLLEKEFGSLSKTLFFEYQNISELADYFADQFPGKFIDQKHVVETPPVMSPPKHERFNAPNRLIPKEKPNTDALDIAIIGVAGRYPGAKNLEDFWQLLKEGKNCITEVPADRWRSELENDPSNYKWGGFLEGIDEFDPLFFGISAAEAALLDPQERLFLQCAWETMEDAGYTRSSLAYDRQTGTKGTVGVYVGVMWDEYQLYGAGATAGNKPLALSGVSGSVANRVSYVGDFNGPSLTLNTMCSSSLTAIHLACLSIHQGECEAAIAGGVNLSLHPNKFRTLAYGNFLSSRGLCESFGKEGDGYVPGEGVGAVLLKPLSKAIADNDHIYAVIKGSAINHGGKTNGYSVPNPKAQGNAIGKALKMAGFDARTLSYLEAHGTGTSLGDPIEITGMTRAFNTSEKHYCAIGSVKSNIGHCESAAGIAGLTKVLLQMKYRQLVPSLHAKALNPNIDFDNASFFVQQELTGWDRPVLDWNGATKEFPRRAGISSFGAGGSNAHLLVEEYVPVAKPQQYHANTPVLVVLSARNETALKQRATDLIAWINQQVDISVDKFISMAFTLQTGREAMKERLALKASSFDELTNTLTKYLAGEQPRNLYTGRVYDTMPMQNGLDPDQLLQAWVKGATVDWYALYTGLPAKISLPAYPFARERYWITAHAETENNDYEEPVVLNIPNDDTHPRLSQKLIYKLKLLLADVVKYDLSLIDEKDPLENYGIDSVMIVTMNRQLAAVYGELPATLFYEYQTLDALAAYFMRDHYDQSMEWTGISNHKNSKQNVAVADKPKGRSKATVASPANNPRLQEPIAIIGMSGQYPAAADLNEYWENLKKGKDCVTGIPADRWSVDDFFEPDPKRAVELGKSYGKWGGFLDGFSHFDPLFFNMSPKEARGTDPQIRLFLECCWQVLEDAGYTRQHITEKYNGNVGVFGGVTRAGFSFYAPQLMKEGQFYLNTMSAVANRVSYVLNLKGPSVPVDTMCSSSLTAIHEACESILQGRCAMAIAGGVNLLLHPAEYVILSANNFLSTDGRCRSFGAGGDGYVPGEGVGAVLLKPLSKAIADKDNIYAVIKGTSINHGGKTNGYTVPNPVAQNEVIRNAIERAGVHAGDITYIEAHGTGTSLGDPIEVTGLTHAFNAHTTATQFCAIGSSKSNIGHLEAAAGIAGLAKIVLQMKHGLLVPSLHAQQTNPNIRFDKTPFYLQHTLSDWKRKVKEVQGVLREQPRLAGISSFGAGGANAHVIVEEYIPDEEAHTTPTMTIDNPALILLSAKNANRLKEYARLVLKAIQDQQYDDHDLPNLAYTLQIGREPMEERLAIATTSLRELQQQLQAFINEDALLPGMFTGRVKDHKETMSLLQTDKDMATVISAWLAGKQYDKLLSFWVKGLAVNWSYMYGTEDQVPRRISAPTYPFDKKAYWINEVAKAPAEEEVHKIMTFEEVWQQYTPEDQSPVKQRAVNTVVWFLSEETNRQTVETQAGAFNNLFIAQTKQSAECWKKIFEEIAANHNEIDAMVYGWPLEHADAIRDFDSIVAILQGIGLAKVKVRQFIFTGAWQIDPATQIDACYLDSWIGFEKSLRLIMPGLQVQSLFIEQTGTAPGFDEWVVKLRAALGTEPRTVLYKNGKRFVLKVQETHLENGHNRLRKGGTYLITGGMGSLGYLLAKHLAVRYAANLVLTGRSPMDAEKLKLVRDLEEAGGQVFYLQADICDRNAMQQGLQQAAARFGNISGIVHTAGVIGAEPFTDKTPDAFQKVLAPKITGTVLLDELFKDEPLDFICYFTSSSAILGDFGACDYSIANRFQMAFAHYRNKLQQQGHRSGIAIAINWPLWKDGGMDLKEEENTKMYLKSSGQRYLMAEEGMALFEQLIAQSTAQHLVVVGQEQKVKRFLGMAPAKAEKKIPIEPKPQPAKPAPKPSQPQSLAQYIEHDLTDLISKAQQMPREELHAEDNLADIGFDSISLSSLALTLSRHYDLEIAPAIFFSYSTIAQLTTFFLTEHKAVMETHYLHQLA